MRMMSALIMIALGALGSTPGCSGSSSPSPPSGTQACGPDRSCPSGYGCAPDLTCWKRGEKPGEVGLSGDASTGDGGGPAALFVGTWRFQEGSTTVTKCASDAPTTEPLGQHVLQIRQGPPADLIVPFNCDFRLALTSAGTEAVVLPQQMCAVLGSDAITRTWSCNKLDIVSTDGGFTATLNADFNLVLQKGASDLGTCKMVATGTLVWESPAIF